MRSYTNWQMAAYVLRLCKRVHDGEVYLSDKYLNVGRLECMISGDVIAISGTNEISDWTRNFDTTLVKNDYGPGRIHQGFKRHSEQLWDQLCTVLDYKRDYIIAGHSQGAGTATAIAYRMHSLNFKIREVWAFGSPRFCDTAYRDSYLAFGIPHHRVVNSYDVITQLPMIRRSEYKHVGNPTKVGCVGALGVLSTVLSPHYTHSHEGYLSAIASIRSCEE